MLIRFYRTGYTPGAGSLVTTSMPGGVATAMKPESKLLREGDEAVAAINGVGKLRHPDGRVKHTL